MTCRRETDTRLESCPMALLELCCRGGGSWLGAHSPERRGFGGCERRQGGLLRGRALHRRG